MMFSATKLHRVRGFRATLDDQVEQQIEVCEVRHDYHLPSLCKGWCQRGMIIQGYRICCSMLFPHFFQTPEEALKNKVEVDTDATVELIKSAQIASSSKSEVSGNMLPGPLERPLNPMLELYSPYHC